MKKPVYHRTYAEIDLSAIRHNFDCLKAKLTPGVKVLSIVKADAYGHGAAAVAAALESRTDFFAVSTVPEGIELRESGITKPILLLSYTSPQEYELLLQHDIRATVYTMDDAKKLSDCALRQGKQAIVHIALDTGMGRIGFLPTPDAADAVAAITQLPGINVEGIFSHYATADMADKTEAEKQTARFCAFLDLLQERGVTIPIRHICNSAGAMEFSEHFDMVRLGVDADTDIFVDLRCHFAGRCGRRALIVHEMARIAVGAEQRIAAALIGFVNFKEHAGRDLTDLFIERHLGEQRFCTLFRCLLHKTRSSPEGNCVSIL